VAGRLSPLDMPAWMRRVEDRLRALDGWRADQASVPVGGAVLWVVGGTPPNGWLVADGGTFDADTYPALQDELGTTTLPTLTAVSGRSWIIRAE
jgi:hypothetical protein